MSQPTDERARRLPFAFAEIDPAIRRELVYLEASDTAQSFAVLYRPASVQPTTAVFLMHPRADFQRHYVAPGLVANGYAVFCANSRYLNSDIDMVHERILLDIAAGMRWLEAAGFERIVLLGNSGGGSLLGFYQSQALLPPGERLKVTPSGEAIPLASEQMPAGDLYIAVAAHQGQGRFMLNVLDPSLTVEGDADSYDPKWDMYKPANGYRPFPESSTYDRAWLAAYRELQHERNLRLDAIARAWLAEHEYFRGQLRSPEYSNMPPEAQGLAARRGRLMRYMTIYRTLANPAYLDPTLDPSSRPLGSIFSPGDPIIGNYGPGGLARVMTPRGWLSTWSSTSSNADLTKTIRGITTPTLIVYADGDCDIFPSEQQELIENAGATDKELRTLPWADHYLFPVGEEGRRLPDPRERLIGMMVPWLRERS